MSQILHHKRNPDFEAQVRQLRQEGHSISAVAKILNCKRGKVDGMIYRARERGEAMPQSNARSGPKPLPFAQEKEFNAASISHTVAELMVKFNLSEYRVRRRLKELSKLRKNPFK